MKNKTVVVKTPSRIHIGLIDMNGSIGRKDGSIGLALEYEGVFVTAKKVIDDVVEINGIDSKLYHNLKKKISNILPQNKGVLISVILNIKQHIGLGSGTQITLAILVAVNKLYNLKYPINKIIEISKRGGTSAIGSLAFKKGGFLIDCGHSNKLKQNFNPSSYCDLKPSKKLLRLKFPNWNIILAIPQGIGLFDVNEQNFFNKYCPIQLSDVQKISHIVLMQLIPSVIEKDIENFGIAISKLQKLGFKKRENDLFKKKNHYLFDVMKKSNIYGPGLSSFGPTMYGFCESKKQALEVQEFLVERFPIGSDIIITKANNNGAKIEYE